MQRNSGHPVITPVSTPRAKSAPSRPLPGAGTPKSKSKAKARHLTLGELPAFLAATKAHPRFDAKPDQSPANTARMQATLAVLVSLVPLKKPRAGADAGKQAKSGVAKEVSHG